MPHQTVQPHFISSNGWRLECLRQQPQDAHGAVPILFLHGIFVGAWCWQHFIRDFAQHGYDAWALSFRGHGRSSIGCEFGLEDFIADAQMAVDEIKRVTGQNPIVVGHSMGGLVLQRLMLSRPLAGAVLLCSMPPQGLLPLALSNLYLRPTDAMVLSKMMLQQQHMTPEQLRMGLFAQPIDSDTLNEYVAQSVTESVALWGQLAQGSMLTPWLNVCPLAVVGASEDVLVPANITALTALTYQVPITWLQGFGHGAMLEQRWPEAALAVRQLIAKMHS